LQLTVSGLIWHRTQILLVKTAFRGWELPGGFVDGSDESLDGALRREVFEEAGCTPAVERLLLVTERVDLRIVNLTFHCNCESSSISPGYECIDAGWFREAQALDAISHWPNRLRLEGALKGERRYVRYRLISGTEQSGRWFIELESS
jgi:8-oxo-dGTP diphosphatase